jgi:hypothetical protein
MSGPFGAGALQLFSGAGDFYSFQPTGSLRFDDADDAYLGRTFGTPTNNKKWTYSVWMKRGNLGTNQAIMSADFDGSNYWDLRFNTSDQIYVQNRIGASNLLLANTTEVFRDVGSFYHIIFVYDSDNSTAADRAIVYVNGVKRTLSANPGSGDASAYNVSGEPHHIGVSRTLNSSGGIWSEFDGYQSEITFVDGQALDETDLGQTKQGIWIPKQYSGSFGNNGFYLPFNSTVTSTGQSTVLYTGTGATRSVEGMGYKPDLLWIKDRTTAYDHHLIDRVRGGSNSVYSNDSVVENTYATNVAFASDGFTIPNGNAVPQIYLNKSSDDFVAWAWDAGADQTATGYGCVLYKGSGSRRPATDIGFSPDLVWIKSRSSTGLGNILFDSVRGVGKYIFSSGTDAEGSGSGIFESFDADGFDLGSNGHVNQSGDNYVAWCWDAGDSASASNTDGSITSTVKASTANGFSIVTGTTPSSYTSYSFGHGLDSAPEFVLWKETENASNWNSWHTGLSSSSNLIQLNTTTAEQSGSYYGTINSSIVTQTGSAFSNVNSDFVAYCWHSVSGYSKIGSYTGNGSATGPTVTCGFRPAFVMIKRIDSSGAWYIFDVNRDPDNKGQRYLRPNVGNSEGGSGTGTEYIDFQSNGFQIIASGSDFADGNTSSATYIYMAFAGGLDTIAPVNTDGSTTSRVKASDDTGFSIVQYEGTGSNATFGHGLSSAPDWIVVKNRSYATNWTVYHSSNTSNPETDYLSLNLTDATADSNVVWNDTAPTSSVVSIGTGDAVNRSGDEFIAYCWTAITGKSAFGSYSGTGSSGNAVTGLGFKPAFLMIKRTDSTGSWMMYDSSREAVNDRDYGLFADTTDAETFQGNGAVSFDSDGFTLNNTGAALNGSGGTYLYMAFVDGQDASFFHDESGNNNSFDPNHINPHDVVPDNPTNNFATMNILDPPVGTSVTLSEGSLKVTGSTSSYSGGVASTFEFESGKWYWEVFINNEVSAGSNHYNFVGAATGDNNEVHKSNNSNIPTVGSGVDGWSYEGDGTVNLTGTGTKATSSVTAPSAGDVLGFAMDLDNGNVYFYLNGVAQYSGSAVITGVTGLKTSPMAGVYNSSAVTFNFGQDSSFVGNKPAQGYTDENGHGDFQYSVPSGYLACCTANLPDPAIDPAANEEPADYFNTVLWTGDGSQTRSLTGVGFQPDFTWMKLRSSTIQDHQLYDVVRGAGGGKNISSNTTAVEGQVNSVNDSDYGYLSSFDSDGFSVNDGAVSTVGGYVNYSGRTYVAWNWLAGGTAASNTDGSITSSVSANPEAGFSIVSYTGNGSTSPYPSVGHGLSSAPEIIFCKSRDSTVAWIVYHTLVDGSLDFLYLHSTNANSNAAPSLPTSSVFYAGGNANQSGEDTIAYCFHSVDGYSKLGSYTGNGSTDGTFLYTGFRPAWVIVKRTNAVEDWHIYDNTRSPENVMKQVLFPNLSDTEATYSSGNVDFLSNGFKWRATGGSYNASGSTYIYLAFAEQPFKYANAR